MFSFTCVYIWANMYTGGKFKLSTFIKDRAYVVYKLNPSSINDAILEDFREKQIIQNVYTFFFRGLTLQGLIKVYHILSMSVCVCVCVCVQIRNLRILYLL
jgi:hypothetical protein